jgi:nitrous oxidase accessory protein NosD
MHIRAKKTIRPVVSLVLFLLAFSLCLGIRKAEAISVNIDKGGFQTISINQQIEFTATPSDGIPPYKFQWCTQQWDSIWGSTIGSLIEVPGATSSTFNFVASTLGTYEISLKIWDSTGSYSYIVGLPTGIWVTVQEATAPKTITVPDDYMTITAAVQNTSDGDTIFVKSGNYNESVEVNKSISLIGEDSETTVITAPLGGVFSGLTPLKIFASNVKIFNLTINNYNALGFGISTIGNGTEIIGNTIHSQTAISTSAPFTTISENSISGYYISVSIASSYCKITNNILSSDGIAVDLEGSSNLVSGNRITGHPTNNDTTGYGILINGNSNIISDNRIEDEDDGIRVGSYMSNNVVTANSVADCSDTGLRIDRWGFNNTCSGNNVTECKYGAGVDLEAYNNTIYQNNFVNNVQQAFVSQPGVFNYWDNGEEGNYWSDFPTKYPNATEIDDSGVWDTPYLINANNTDNYPLTVPYGTLAPQPEQEPFPILLVVAVALTLMVVVSVSLLVYFKKRKRNNETR